MDSDIINKIKMLADSACKYFSFEQVILYGSYSNNTNRPDSDIDVAFIVNETNPNHWELSAKLYEIIDGIDPRIEPIIINQITDKSGFANNIIKNGIIVN